MLRPKDFLLLECENVRLLLHSTLRYAYSSKSSTQVYQECLGRLNLIKAELLDAEESEGEEIQELWVQLSNLSDLIGQVERSHIEEFSWPFARALQSLAVDVCGSNSSAQYSDSPLFFISADDTLGSYAINTEQGYPGLRYRPLFNIIFPRSLKNFVLLHPILGHEVAHAAFAVPQIGNQLTADVLRPLIAGSALTDRAAFETWLESIGQELEPDLIDSALLQWPEELYCDLFGLLMMGPSYIGATCTLSQPFDVRGVSESHPPSLTRYRMLESAASHLGWLPRSKDGGSALGKLGSAYFNSLRSLTGGTPVGFRLLKSSSIKRAIQNLRRFMEPLGKTLFQMPDSRTLDEMVKRLILARPPVESTVTNRLAIRNDNVDFRSILFAGWLAAYDVMKRVPEPKFLNVNLLCDRGILQQSAVAYWESEKTASQSGPTG